MKKLLCAALILMGTAPLVRAADDSATQRLLDAALKQEQAFLEASTSFVLEADFTAQTPLVTGHVKLRRESKDHSWSWVDFGDFQQISVQDGGEEYEARNLAFTPIRVSQLAGLLHLSGLPTPMKAQKEKTHSEGGRQLDCVQGQKQDLGKQVNELCVDVSTRDLVSVSWRDDQDLTHIDRYSEYMESEGRRYPTLLELAVNNTTLLSVTIKSFKSAPFDPALLQPPKGPIERRHCQGMKPPAVVSKSDFDVPEKSGRPSSNTLAMVALTVLTDGTVGDANLLEMGNNVLDDTVLAMVKKWKFKPAMCGDEAVVADVTVEVNFRIIP